LYAQVTISTGAHDNVLLVPKTALLDGGDGSAALVTVQNGIAERRPVSVGFQNDRFVEILSGLQDGDLVAISGLADLADGEHVIAQVVDNPVALVR